MWIAGGKLYGYTADTVFTDRSIRAEPRQLEWAVFRGDSAIEWHPETRPVRITHRLDREFVQEEVTFANGDVELAGTLLLPAGAGPHPAAVLVHGSGPAERTNLLSLLRADLFLRRGIAVLVYDKRGVGGSSGDWEGAGIEELAGDAAAGVALLRRHPRIAAGAVGLIGHSQAGWVIPAAAVRETGADFLVVLSGGGVSPKEQEIFRSRAEAGGAGLSADTAAHLMELKWRYAETGEDWDEYVAGVRAADPRITALVEAPIDRDSARWVLVEKLARYVPLSDLRAIRVPTLVVFGAEDDNVPVARAAEIWREAVPSSLLTVETIPGVGHGLVGLREGRGSVFPAALVRAVGDWLDARPWSSGRR
jgi:pimeloyl-ACP methyl ester carboxylesterase